MKWTTPINNLEYQADQIKANNRVVSRFELNIECAKVEALRAIAEQLELLNKHIATMNRIEATKDGG